MKALANIFVVTAVLSGIAAVVCRIRLAPIIGLPAKAYLGIADTALLFAIAFLLLEKSSTK
jgi:hypothetical protein